jgi:hypothetical protein
LVLGIVWDLEFGIWDFPKGPWNFEFEIWDLLGIWVLGFGI